MLSRERGHYEELIWLLPITAVTAVLFLAGELVGSAHGVTATALLHDYTWKTLRLLPLLGQVALLALLARALLLRGQGPARILLQPLRARFGSPLLIAAAAGPLLLMPLLFSGFGVLKMLMPQFAPFSWDDDFAAADRILFLGRQPWTVTHALFGSAPATVVIDRIYTLWILFLSAAITGFALFVPRYDRARFFLAFTAAWLLLGVVGAYLTSSAGPCYAQQVDAASAHEFAPLMARLHHISDTQSLLGAVEWQQVLWSAHSERRYAFGMGISAMPSLHNAIAVLYAFALARFGRAHGAAGWLFALVIFIGSIHLGWHYAVDGLVAAAAMAAIWWAAGRYLELTGYAAAAREPRGTADTSVRPLPA